MKTMVVVGGGAAGMMAAVSAALNGENLKVILLEKNEKPGKKLFITGKGRCNITNLSDVSDILENVVSNPFFLYSSFYSMDSYALVKFFNDAGLKTQVERGNRVFPQSGKSSDVIKTLRTLMDGAGVQVRLNTKVTGIDITDGAVCAVKVIKCEIGSNSRQCANTDTEIIKAGSVIIATGGLSYAQTGSDGDGYKFARDAGHKIVKCFPSLVGLSSSDADIFELAGLTLKNAGVKTFVSGKAVHTGFGEVLFTHGGISGPVILSASRFVTKELENGDNRDIYVSIDLKPALTEKELDMRIQRDFAQNLNKNFANSLDGLLPQSIIPVIIKKSGIAANKKVNAVTKTERAALVNLLKNFRADINGTEGFSRAVVTCGGVDVNEVNPKTLESKLVKGLYFAGEVLDVDAFTGGYNLQIAFSTGYLAGKSAASAK
ncbi:MAG: NAD(P)/FAD-dependent oxidoreductase [Clostridiales bacterium]|jgi:predicted Rossmann fold flavoprotein|nr:NAD(P)/FAD-dependent oxidoreductase [Clostridiales bacterium]